MSVTSESGSPRSSALLSPTTLYEEEQHHQAYYYDDDAEREHTHTPLAGRSPPNGRVTRTVAMIKYHALAHRFDIEPRIQAAGFEIVKERQMEFDTETDPDTLVELFGDDASCLAEGPVWVYVLERRRAVQVWKALMGDRDPDVARKESPSSLRALYGISRDQNGLMGSSDEETAEIQIASLFVSSPPFPNVDLPDDAGSYYQRREYAHSTSPRSGSQKYNANGKPLFRARPIPRTNEVPDIVPRTTRAAALRAGTAVIDKSPVAPREPISEERKKETFANVPGHKRSEVIQVASTAAPTIAPRMTKAAALRLGQKPVEQPKRRSLTTEEAKATFEGVPGHKRRESIAVASTKAPTLAPRLNKSAALRANKDQAAPPTSYVFKESPKASGSIARSPSQELSPTPKSRADHPPRPASQASPSHKALTSRPASVIGGRPPSALNGATKPQPSARPSTSGGLPATNNSTAADTKRNSVSPQATQTAKPARRNSISTSLPPSIAPRTNRSAALRAAKQEAEANAAAALAAKRNSRAATRGPPSSFKAPQIAT
ncbi:hypothetical protein AX16_007981 [Volvariella volvacea WC 439]|nr:hypothetical protein AX16_007981 [Volvariella volvacea WC 439]